MRRACTLSLLCGLIAASASADVTFEKIVKTLDPMPGRGSPYIVFNGLVLQNSYYMGEIPGCLSRPSINDSGAVVFRGTGSYAYNQNQDMTTGLYAKEPNQPLIRLVDNANTPTFEVPGRPAGTIFLDFDPPMLTNDGRVVFYAMFGGTSSGNGFYWMSVSGGTIYKIVDSLDQVPGWPGTTFLYGFRYNFAGPLLYISANDAGWAVFHGRFKPSTEQYEQSGLFGVNLNTGGAPIRLADTTGTVGVIGQTLKVTGLSQSHGPAINNNGIVIFEGAIGSSMPGVFTVPVDGSALPTPRALQYQQVNVSAGAPRYLYTIFGGHDINENGDFVFQHTFGSGPSDVNAVFAGNVAGGPLRSIIDGAGGYAVPGRTGAVFNNIYYAPLSNGGDLGITTWDNSTGGGKGMYAVKHAGGTLTTVAASGQVPPGRDAPAAISSFYDSGAAVNDLGNLAFSPAEASGSTQIFGLYFFEKCSGQLQRVVDDTTCAPDDPNGLGDSFATSGDRFFRIWQGKFVRNGHYRSFNNSNQIAMLTAFNSSNAGIYIANITSGGSVQIDSCPANVTLECPANIDPTNTGTAVASGCGTVNVTYQDTSVVSCGNASTITRTWTATNGTSTATCVQTITLVDSTPPVLTVPAAATVECGGDTSTASIGIATATDTCDTAPIVNHADSEAAGACVGTKVITRTWTATDACGNTSSAAQIITVVDTTAPALTAPADATVPCGGDTSPTATGEATATDTCAATPAVTYVDSNITGACAGSSVITRTWTATDACGNTANAAQIITVVDTTAPALIAPADATVPCGGDTSPTATGEATATDTCDAAPAVTYVDSDIPGACVGAMVITRTWTATDACGNAANAAQTITVVDSVAPELSIPPNASVTCGGNTLPPATGTATASDVCDPAPAVAYSDSVTPGPNPGTSVITRTWTATDHCGNAASGVQTITVADTTPPVLTVPTDKTVQCGGNTTPAATGIATATDNCDPAPVVTHSDVVTPGACASASLITRTWTATDAYGNSGSAVQLILVVDTTPPVLTVNTNPITVTDTNCSGGEAATLPPATATDNCGGNVTVTNNAPATFPAGQTTTVTYTATDACGNTATAHVDVNVRYGSNIDVIAQQYIVGWGTRPPVQREPLDNIPIVAFSIAPGTCARELLEDHWWLMCFALPDIFAQCTPAASGVTNGAGCVRLNLPPGNYLIASHFDVDGDGDLDMYLGQVACHLNCHETTVERLYMFTLAVGRHMGGKCYRFTGSELLVVEPEEVTWDGTEQQYPFVFDSQGDWEVTVSVAPPEGFVADYDELSETVASDLRAVQFTITELGSDLVPTQTSFDITHKGRRQLFQSSIGLKLTPDYARARLRR